ncbi:hypothetical protein HAX54_016509 [Datura stramonium]|uniref:Protein SPT2 homolog n=1 Tax=Datura stramonium TaxID=4076 RepID=A0ABS8S038_DATST|nr:hypothetical protein [Datura stramonium]
MGESVNDREVQKPIPGSSQMQSKLLTQKSVSVGKQTQLTLDSRKQLGSSKGRAGPASGAKSSASPNHRWSKRQEGSDTGSQEQFMPALHKPTPSKLQPSVPRQSLVQKKEILQSGKSKVMPKQAEPSYKHKLIMQKQAVPSANSQIKQLPPKMQLVSLEDRRPSRKPIRHDEEDDEAEAISTIRRMFGYDPNRYQDEDDTSDMEANFDDILREENEVQK